MKHTIFFLMAFCFLGMDSLPNTSVSNNPISFHSEYKRTTRPTMEQKIQLAKSKLKVLTSEVSVGIAELKFNQ